MRKRNCNANTLDYFNLPECTLPFGRFFPLVLHPSRFVCLMVCFFKTSLISLLLPACVIEKSKWWNRLNVFNKYSNEEKEKGTHENVAKEEGHTEIESENKIPTNVCIAQIWHFHISFWFVCSRKVECFARWKSCFFCCSFTLSQC